MIFSRQNEPQDTGWYWYKKRGMLPIPVRVTWKRFARSRRLWCGKSQVSNLRGLWGSFISKTPKVEVYKHEVQKIEVHQ